MKVIKIGTLTILLLLGAYILNATAEIGTKDNPLSLSYRECKYVTIEGNQTINLTFVCSETGTEDVEATWIQDIFDNNGNITGSLYKFTSKEIYPGGYFKNDTKLYVFQDINSRFLFYVTVNYSSIPAVEDPRIANLTEQVNNLSAELNETKSQIDSLKSQIDNLNKHVDKLKEENTNLTMENQRLKKEVTKLKKEANNLLNNFFIPFVIGGVVVSLPFFVFVRRKKSIGKEKEIKPEDKEEKGYENLPEEFREASRKTQDKLWKTGDTEEEFGGF
ncbi:MAG: hypothetical protein J7K95_00315 [Thermoplasmata archaeon]|nr:hypothetical protein [Thermoplasmata archaeon]